LLQARALKPLAIIVLAGSLLAGALALRGILTDLPDPGAAAAPHDAQSILFLDRHGRPLYEAIDPNGNKNVPLPLDTIPDACRQATIATEDSRFYSHHGVDPLAIARAVIQDVRYVLQGEQSRFSFSGASTLTQQLARNLYLDASERQERTLRRKLREAWLAWRMEQTHSKDDLLALYLNSTYYGHFATGIEGAAKAYFGVGASELDLAQCALLAGLPQYPAGYNPIENPEAAKLRQGVVLGLMVQAGYISAAQAEDASREALAYASTPFPIEAPHFVMWVNNQLPQLIGPSVVRRGGLRVITTLDLDEQRLADEIVHRRLQQLRPCAASGGASDCDPEANPARRADNAALTAIDPESGAVRVMVGSPDYFDAQISGAVNATLAMRQPGSAIKPLTYAAAFDPDRARTRGSAPWTAATVIADLRTSFPTDEGRPYAPQNYDLRYHGPVTVRAALANSYNIPAVKALQYVGVDALLEQAELLGIPWRVSGPPQPAVGAAEQVEAGAPSYGLALTLGGGAVSLLGLTSAYAAFANGGERITPHGITRIETLDGRVLYDAASDAGLTPRAALDARVAFLITDILSDALARLPAFGPGNPLELGFPAAAKTGTTTDWRDNWTIGYTRELVAGVWVGNADNTPMLDVSGISGAGPIWHDFMLRALAGHPAGGFEIPEGLTRVEICADSGLLPAPATVSVGEEIVIPCPFRRMEWFIEGTEPTETDRSHIVVQIDTQTGQRAGSASGGVATAQTFWILPEEYQAWAKENGVPQPPGNGIAWAPDQDSARVANALTLLSPDPNRVYRLDPMLPRNDQAVPVSVFVPSALDPASVALVADGELLAQLSGPDYTGWWALQSGEHSLQAVAIRRDGSRVTSDPVVIRVVE
jgi:penicillin-binding protein 1C